MASFNHIGGAEPSTLTFKLATVVQTRNSSAMHQEILTIGDPDSSLALAAVLNAAPASTAWALAVRRVGDSTSIIHGDSTVFQGGTWTVRATLSSTSADNPVRANLSSTAADNPVAISGNSTAFQGGSWTVRANLSSTSTDNPVRALLSSTAADNPVVVSGNSTVFQGGGAWSIQGNSTVAPLAGSLWTVQGNSTVAPLAGSTWNTRPLQSSAADLQMTATPLAGSTWNTRPIQSSAADLQVTATQSAAVWTFNIGTHIQSTVAPSSNSSGVVVRQVVDNILTLASTNAFASTSLVIQSSGAGLRSYVTAYSILTTNAGPTKIAFYSSGTMTWPLVLAAVSSAVTGVNLAVSAPAYLFRTNNQEALTLQTKGSTIAGWHVAVAYFRAP